LIQKRRYLIDISLVNIVKMILMDLNYLCILLSK
jgi:hypothetical protein